MKPSETNTVPDSAPNITPHTPGEWSAGVTMPDSSGTVYNFRTTITTRTEQVALIIQAGSRERTEAKANAELFAAAPDLLVACQAVLNGTPFDESYRDLCRAGVTKALVGQSPVALPPSPSADTLSARGAATQFNHELLSTLEKVTAFAAQFSPGGRTRQERAIITELENCCVNLEGILGTARAAIAKAKGNQA